MLCSEDVRITIGRHTYGNPKLLVWDEEDRIEIGSFCSIADGVTIFGGGEHNLDWITTYPMRIAFGLENAGKDGHPASKGNTRIGNDVWLGYGSTVLSGVTIGDGAVIGAGAVIVRDVPAYAVFAGNPARLIRYRFTDEDISALLQIAWWDWPDQKIHDHIPLLCSSEVRSFVDSHSPQSNQVTP